MKRRRAITIFGAAALGGLVSCRRPAPLRTFSHIAFGTEVRFQIHGISEATFGKLSSECAARLRELESLFSLYDPDSAISRLNREGFAESPPVEFLEVITTALGYGEKTGGIFDITVQPLWLWREAWKNANLTERREMEGTPWDEALSRVDYRKVSVTRHRVEFGKAGMAITLNGIVQGYATDQVVSLLKKGGVANALIDIGEYAALGDAPDGNPWEAELSASGERITLPSGRALAVSAGSGHTFDPDGRFHHIFRPSDGMNTRPDSTIVVTAPTATEADALSTTFTIATERERSTIIKNFPEADFREIK